VLGFALNKGKRLMPTLTQVTPYVYWLPPADPDRPSVCIVVGSRSTLMLDGSASPAHAQLFLDELAAYGIAPPRFVARTHRHWDHIFCTAHLNIPVIAHALMYPVFLFNDKALIEPSRATPEYPHPL
jgi:glyoxylase-like metal-dependent hydrolase (beta-lactamase superfamily II)